MVIYHKIIIKFKKREELLKLEKFLNQKKYEYNIEMNPNLFPKTRIKRLQIITNNWNKEKSPYRNYITARSKGYHHKQKRYYTDLKYIARLQLYEEQTKTDKNDRRN